MRNLEQKPIVERVYVGGPKDGIRLPSDYFPSALRFRRGKKTTCRYVLMKEDPWRGVAYYAERGMDHDEFFRLVRDLIPVDD